MAKPNSPSPHLILQTLKNRWRLVLSWTLFFLVLAGGLFWLGHEDKRIRPAIPPTVNDNTITFSSRPDGIRTEAVDAAGVVETGYPGRLVWAEDRTSRIRSPFNGRIVRGLSARRHPGRRIRRRHAPGRPGKRRAHRRRRRRSFRCR